MNDLEHLTLRVQSLQSDVKKLELERNTFRDLKNQLVLELNEFTRRNGDLLSLCKELEGEQVKRHEAENLLDTLRKANAAWRADVESLTASNMSLIYALEVIAGDRQCADNLMSDKEIARVALSRAKEVLSNG